MKNLHTFTVFFIFVIFAVVVDVNASGLSVERPAIAQVGTFASAGTIEAHPAIPDPMRGLARTSEIGTPVYGSDPMDPGVCSIGKYFIVAGFQDYDAYTDDGIYMKTIQAKLVDKLKGLGFEIYRYGTVKPNKWAWVLYLCYSGPTLYYESGMGDNPVKLRKEMDQKLAELGTHFNGNVLYPHPVSWFIHKASAEDGWYDYRIIYY